MAKVTPKKGAATRRRRERKNIESGAVHIQSTFNNTIRLSPLLRQRRTLLRSMVSRESRFM